MPENVTPIRLPISCLAEFVAGAGRSPESLLRPFKFRARGEGFARSSYYQDLLSAVRDYHSNDNDLKLFQSARAELHRKREYSTKGWEQIKLEKNILAIGAYERVYGNRRFKILPNHRIDYRLGPLVLTAQPDLWVTEEGTQVLLKIGIAKKKPIYRDILLTAIRKAAVSKGYKVRAKNVVYLNISTATEHICRAGLTDFNHTFISAARAIAKIWPSLKPRATAPGPAVATSERPLA